MRFLLEKYALYNRSLVESTLNFIITHENADILETFIVLDFEEVDSKTLTPLLQALLPEGCDGREIRRNFPSCAS